MLSGNREVLIEYEWKIKQWLSTQGLSNITLLIQTIYYVPFYQYKFQGHVSKTHKTRGWFCSLHGGLPLEGLLKRSSEIKDNVLFQIKAIISVPSKGTSGKKTLVHQYSPWKNTALPTVQNIDNIVLLQNILLFCDMTMLHVFPLRLDVKQ